MFESRNYVQFYLLTMVEMVIPHVIKWVIKFRDLTSKIGLCINAYKRHSMFDLSIC